MWDTRLCIHTWFHLLPDPTVLTQPWHSGTPSRVYLTLSCLLLTPSLAAGPVSVGRRSLREGSGFLGGSGAALQAPCCSQPLWLPGQQMHSPTCLRHIKVWSMIHFLISALKSAGNSAHPHEIWSHCGAQLIPGLTAQVTLLDAALLSLACSSSADFFLCWMTWSLPARRFPCCWGEEGHFSCESGLFQGPAYHKAE